MSGSKVVAFPTERAIRQPVVHLLRLIALRNLWIRRTAAADAGSARGGAA